MRNLVQLNRIVLSPLVAFPLAWVGAALLSQIHLLNVQTPWTSTVWSVVLIVPVAFLAGGLIGSGLGSLSGSGFSTRIALLSENRVRLLLLVLLAVGYAELIHQFVKIGGVPLISPDGNIIRFNQGGPSVVLINLLTVAGLIAFVRPFSLLARESRFELFAAAVAMSGFALQSSRGSLALMIVVAVAARWLYWGRPKTWLLFGAGVAAFAVVTFGFYLRVRQAPFLPFEAELFGEVLPGMPFFLKPLVPAYLAIVTNFYALQGLIIEFPDFSSFGMGAYNSLGADLILPGALNISTVSGEITPPWVTSTVAGPLWADGGYPVVILGVAVTGLLSAAAFTLARRTTSLGWCLTAGYLFYVTIFGLYTNLWTQQIDWLMVGPLLLVLGSYCDPRRSGTRRPDFASSTIDPMSADPGASRMSTPQSRSKQAKSWVALGGGALLVLIVSGVVLQQLLPKALPPAGFEPLPPSIQSARNTMADGDGTAENGALYWTSRRGQGRYVLYRRLPLADGPAKRLRVLRLAGSRNPSFDIARWYTGSLSVFAMEQLANELILSVSPISSGAGRTRTFRAPVPEAPRGQINDYALATYGGELADLFVITRGSLRSRVHLRVFSGESGFRKVILDQRLPFAGLDPKTWSLDVGSISREIDEDVRPVPDLLLVRHDQDKRWTDVQLMMGERDFRSISYQRDIQISGDTGARSRFLLGSDLGSPTLYVVGPENASRLDVVVFSLGLLETPP